MLDYIKFNLEFDIILFILRKVVESVFLEL